MQKIVVVENNIKERILVCKDPSTINIKKGQSTHTATGKVRKGEPFIPEQSPNKFPYMIAGIALTIGGAIATLICYFVV